MNFNEQASANRQILIVINPTQAQVSTLPDSADSNVIVDGIYDGSMHLTRSLVNNELNFGEVSSAMFEVKLSNNVGFENDELAVWQTLSNDNETISKLLFYGIISSSKLDKNGYYREIVAYDKLSTVFATDIAEWYKSVYESREKISVADLRKSLLNYLGLTYQNKTLANDSIELPIAMDVTSIKALDLFKSIGQIQGFIPYFTDNVKYYTFSGNQVDLSNEIRGNESTFEDYVTEPIDGVKIFQSESTTVATYGTCDNYYPITDNILLSVLDVDTLNSVASNLYNQINGITYAPSELNLIYSDVNVNLGDVITVGDKTLYALELELSGAQLIKEVIRCSGNRLLTENENKSLDPVYSKINNRLVKAEIGTEKIDFLLQENEQTSEIELTTDGITLISENINLEGNTTIQALDNKIDSIEVGGRNYLQGSKTMLSYAVAEYITDGTNRFTDGTNRFYI